MDLNFTTKSQEALSAAVRMAAGAGNAHVEPVHILAALLDQGEGIAGALLNAVGVDRADLAAAVQQQLQAIPSATGSSVSAPQLSQSSLQVLQAAENLAKDRGDEFVSTEHILVGLAQIEPTAPLLDSRGATPAALLDALTNVMGSSRVRSAESRGYLPSPGEVRRGPDRAGPGGQDRSGDRA